MTDLAHIIRNYHAEDFANLFQLGAEVEALEEAGWPGDLQDVLDDVRRPKHAAEKNLFVAENKGGIAGYVDITPELDIGRVVLRCLVHPEHRRKGLATELVGHAMNRIRELKIGLAHVNVSQDNAIARRWSSRMGFQCIRRFLELHLDLSVSHLQKTPLIIFPCRTLRPGEEDRLTQIQNRAFMETWGYNPNTLEDIIYRTSLPHYAHEHIIVCWKGDRPVSYCWTAMNSGPDNALKRDERRIYMLGVDPDYRGKGLGKRALLVGLSHLKSEGIRIDIPECNFY